ncbi:hypothetical protein [Coleofasciculus sp. FACHB-1120]|uniref:hypothetical protein n=1 Tax=Coleofasciculus sp. FACHB-1120 TaxID=2692783 RepID=UPI001A7ED288|nr:hypothetical protein [Coleofasciculus sp. FACHB-1120]
MKRLRDRRLAKSINMAVENIAILYWIEYGLTPLQLLSACPGGIQYTRLRERRRVGGEILEIALRSENPYKPNL